MHPAFLRRTCRIAGALRARGVAEAGSVEAIRLETVVTNPHMVRRAAQIVLEASTLGLLMEKGMDRCRSRPRPRLRRP